MPNGCVDWQVISRLLYNNWLTLEPSLNRPPWKSLEKSFQEVKAGVNLLEIAPARRGELGDFLPDSEELPSPEQSLRHHQKPE